MSVDAIQISFLPKLIHNDEVENALRNQLPNVFAGSNQRIRAQVYSEGAATAAIVVGFSTNWEKLCLDMRTVVFESSRSGKMTTNVNIKVDTGEPRSRPRGFDINQTPTNRRNFERLAGITPRKVLGIFSDGLLRELEPIFRGHSVVLYIPHLLPDQLNTDMLKKPGRPSTIKHYQNDCGTMLRYGSELEIMQAIVYLNENCEISYKGDPIHVSNITGKLSAKSELAHGLGSNGECVDIEGIAKEHGFIPFGKLGEKILNTTFIAKMCVALKCWKCKSYYHPLGITITLSNIAAKCDCAYIRNESFANEAVFYANENFTRLVPAQSLVPNQRPSELNFFCVQYPPFKRTYNSKSDYVDTILPLLFEDWKVVSTAFKSDNQTNGRIVNLREIEFDPDSEKTLVAIKIRVPTTDVWVHGNPKCVLQLTLSYYGDDQIRHELKKVDLARITTDGTISFLYVQTSFKSQNPPRKNDVVIITPKANKTDYNSTKQTLRKWLNNEGNLDEPLTTVLLSPLGQAQYWQLEEGLIPKKVEIGDDHYDRVKNWTTRLLNTEQLDAVNQAIKSNMSFIHGPPGTGKTFTLGVLINVLYQLEEGNILVVTPSNYAADGIARSIANTSMPNAPSPGILRIYAKSIEEYPFSSAPRVDPFFRLDEEVQRTQEYLYSEDTAEFRSLVHLNKRELFTKSQSSLYRETKLQLEMREMDQYNIFITTVGALSDHRFKSWAKRNNVSTTVVDEAGQLLHVHTVNLSTLSTPRYVFAGDPDQLSPSCTSEAGKIAGFEISLMEHVNLCRIMEERLGLCTPPWTQLLVQHRMHPHIGNLVSKVTYMGNLKHAKSIDETTNVLMGSLEKLCDGKRIILLKHDEIEQKVKTSYVNDFEAGIIVRKVKELLENGITEDMIQILTLYEAQRKLIKEKLDTANILVSVKNCDAFQGREAPICILSLVRANAKADVGFAANRNRLNVSISRAQQFLFIACNFSCFEKLKYQHWQTFCAELKASALFSNK